MKITLVTIAFLTQNLLMAQDTASEGMNLVRRTHVVGPDAWAVPLGFFALIFGIIFLVQLFKHKQRMQLLKSIEKMVEKGLNVPLELILPPTKNTIQNDFRKGVLLASSGLAIGFFFYFNDPSTTDWAIGLIPLALGGSYLLFAKYFSTSNV